MNFINDTNYRAFPAVSNSDLTWLEEYWLPQHVIIDLRKAYANGTLIDAMITEQEKVDYFKLTVTGEDYQYSADEFAAAKEMKKAVKNIDYSAICPSAQYQCLQTFNMCNPTKKLT